MNIRSNEMRNARPVKKRLAMPKESVKRMKLLVRDARKMDSAARRPEPKMVVRNPMRYATRSPNWMPVLVAKMIHM